jgi:hypothetical protein
MNSCENDELTIDDFRGYCCFVDIGLAVIRGYAGLALVMNINRSAFDSLTQPGFGAALFWARANPKAILLSRGNTVGAQASATISGSIGLVW